MGYNKKILSEATAGLNKAKAPKKQQDIIVDPRGQWDHPGEPTRIPGNNITMQGVPYPVYGVDNTGFAQMMYPGQDYQFQGDYVDEYPMMKKGGSLPKMPKKKNSKGYSRSLSATNKIFTQNALTKKKKTKKKKVFDPNSKYYQIGGTPYNISGPVSEQDEIQEYTPVLKPKAYGHEPEDYLQFQNFAQTLPSNLQNPGYQYGNPDQYDMYSMWSTVGKPASFADVQDTDYFPLQDDGTYHGFSVGDDGTLLKPMKHGTTWMEVMNSELNTDPYFRENRLIQNEQGRLQYVPRKQYGGDISIPELTKTQEGGIICPPGQKPDGKGGCILTGEVEVEEQVIYGDPAKDKQQTSLMNQLRQVKGAYQDWREGAGLRKARLNNEGSSSIEGLKKQIADYKKELAEEKKAYDKAGKALNVLKKQRPDEWKNAKLADVMSGKGIEALRSLYSEEKISDQTFRDFYNTFGKEFDPNVAEGKGPGAQYSAREARENYMQNVPEFVENVGTFAKAAALTPAMLALAPTAPLINAGSAVARVASPFMQAARTAWTNPMLKALPGSSARNAVASYYLGETLTDTPEVLRSIGQGFTGEKEWSDVAAEAGMHTFDLATSGATKNIGAGIKALKPEAKAVTKFLDRPFSTYGKKMNLVAAIADNPNYQKFEKFTGSMYPKFLGEVRSLNKMTPADVLKAQTVGTNLWNLPETVRSIGADASLVADQNLTPEERLLAAGRIGRNTVMTSLGAAPIFRKTAPLYSRDWANKIFLADNLLKGIVYQDPTSARALLNASRVLAKQEGGQTSSYTDDLTQKEIDELIKQGYNIEYLD